MDKDLWQPQEEENQMLKEAINQKLCRVFNWEEAKFWLPISWMNFPYRSTITQIHPLTRFGAEEEAIISNNNKSNKAQIMFNYKDRYFGDFRLYFEQTFRSAKIYRITTRLFN